MLKMKEFMQNYKQQRYTVQNFESGFDHQPSGHNWSHKLWKFQNCFCKGWG